MSRESGETLSWTGAGYAPAGVGSIPRKGEETVLMGELIDLAKARAERKAKEEEERVREEKLRLRDLQRARLAEEQENKVKEELSSRLKTLDIDKTTKN